MAVIKCAQVEGGGQKSLILLPIVKVPPAPPEQQIIDVVVMKDADHGIRVTVNKSDLENALKDLDKTYYNPKTGR